MVILKQYKKPAPKPYTCKCSICTRRLFYSSAKEQILKYAKDYILCPYCKNKIIVKEWVIIIRQNKIDKIINKQIPDEKRKTRWRNFIRNHRKNGNG